MRGVSSVRALLWAVLALPVALTSLAPVALGAPAALGALAALSTPAANDAQYLVDASVSLRPTGVWNSSAAAMRRPNRTAVFVLRIRNDGQSDDHFFVRSALSEPGYAVRFIQRGVVADAVESGAYLTPTVQPGESVRLLVRVRVKLGALVGSRLDRLITVSSAAHPMATDQVQIAVSRR